MSIIETVLVFVGIPVAVVAVIAGLVYAGATRRSKRYRPGRPFEFTPVWFLSAPGPNFASHGRPALEASNRPALTKGETATDQPAGRARPHEATGGASDRW